MEKKKAQPKENYLDQLQRLQAEFENYQKRVEKEKIEKAKYASTTLLKKLLTLTDMFEQALKSLQGEDEHTKGVKMIHQALLKTRQRVQPRRTRSTNKSSK